jgi:hypothetical protein
MRPGMNRVFSDMPEQHREDWIYIAKAPLRSKGEQPFPVTTQQFGVRKMRLPGMLQTSGKRPGLTALSHLLEDALSRSLLAP